MLRRHKSSSVLHRTALLEQESYLDQLDELFPWVEVGEGQVGASSEKKGSGTRGHGGKGGDGKDSAGTEEGGGGGAKEAVVVTQSSAAAYQEWYVCLSVCLSVKSRGHLSTLCA